MSMCTMSVGLTDHLTDTEVTSMNKLLIYKVKGGAREGIIWSFSCSFFLLLRSKDLLNTECSLQVFRY